jgi:hypothetical protein
MTRRCVNRAWICFSVARLLKDVGSRVVCFSHTLQETENLLLASAQMLTARSTDGRHSNEIISYAISRGQGRTYLEMKAVRVESDLQNLGISVRDAPDYQVRTTCDETRMEEVLQAVVGYLRPETRLYDVKSLTAIWRLRGGRSQRNLESARAIFVTSNGNLVRASKQFFEEVPNGLQVPVCALDSQLGTLVWLKQPMAAPDLPKRQIIADCVAALEPGNRLWQRFLEVVDQTREAGGVSEEDYATLRYTVSARRALVEETLGDEGALTIGSVDDILRRAKAAMTQEAQERVRAERTARLDAEIKAEAELRRADTAEENLTAERDRHQLELQSRSATQGAELADRIGNKAHRRALRVARVVYLLLAFAVIGGTAAALGLIAGGVATAFVIVAGGLAATHTIVGKSLADLRQRLETVFQRKFEDWERKSLGL